MVGHLVELLGEIKHDLHETVHEVGRGDLTPAPAWNLYVVHPEPAEFFLDVVLLRLRASPARFSIPCLSHVRRWTDQAGDGQMEGRSRYIHSNLTQTGATVASVRCFPGANEWEYCVT